MVEATIYFHDRFEASADSPITCVPAVAGSLRTGTRA